MTEEQIKFVCKQFVENSKRPLTELDKELIKRAIDKSKNFPEMILSILSILSAQ